MRERERENLNEPKTEATVFSYSSFGSDIQSLLPFLVIKRKSLDLVTRGGDYTR